MTKDVFVSISGLQAEFPGDEEEENLPLEVVTPGSYFLKNGKHYVMYDELVEGVPGVIKNKIKINGNDSIEIIKTGITNAHMVFEKNKKYITYYQTPYGQMLIGINTSRMDVQVREEKIDVQVEYELDINHAPFADCAITMNIVPRDGKTIELL